MPSVTLKLPSAPVREQIEGKLAWNRARCADGADFFSLGYSGKSIEEIVLTLKRHGVRVLIDIRKHAVSMHRPEFSKRNLARTLGENGIGYDHRPELGVPREVRSKAVEAESRATIWDWYDDHLISNSAALRSFVLSVDRPAALLCTERDPHECHRHRLCLALEAMGLTSYDL